MSVQAKALINSSFAPLAAFVYTAPVNTHAILDKFTAYNSHSAAVTLSLYLVPSGGTKGDSNTLVKAKSLAAGVIEDVLEIRTHTLNPGDQIYVEASVADKLAIRLSGREVT